MWTLGLRRYRTGLLATLCSGAGHPGHLNEKVALCGNATVCIQDARTPRGCRSHSGTLLYSTCTTEQVLACLARRAASVQMTLGSASLGLVSRTNLVKSRRRRRRGSLAYANFLLLRQL